MSVSDAWQAEPQNGLRAVVAAWWVVCGLQPSSTGLGLVLGNPPRNVRSRGCGCKRLLWFIGLLALLPRAWYLL